MTGPALEQTANGGSSVSLAATTSGNLLTLAVWYFADSPPIPAITGWTALAARSDPTYFTHAVEVWYRISDGTEGGGTYTPDIDWTGVDQFGGYDIVISEWSNPNSDPLLDGATRTGTQAFDGPVTLASITTTADDGVLLFYGFTQSDTLSDVTPPSGATDLYNGGGSGEYAGYEVISTAGATGSRSFDADPSDDSQVNLGIMFVLAADGASPPGGPDVEISGEGASIAVNATNGSVSIYTPPRIGGILRTGPPSPLAIARTSPSTPLALSRTGPATPIAVNRTGPAAPIAITRTKGEL